MKQRILKRSDVKEETGEVVADCFEEAGEFLQFLTADEKSIEFPEALKEELREKLWEKIEARIKPDVG